MMCGFIGATGKTLIADDMIRCLMKIEHTHFDITGIISSGHSDIPDDKSRIRLESLQQSHAGKITGYTAIAKIFWSSAEWSENSVLQPYVTTGHIAIVQNSILLNAEAVRDGLKTKGYTPVSQSDTELIGLLIQHYAGIKKEFTEAIKAATDELQGSYAIVFLNPLKPNHLYAICRESTLVIGVGSDKNFVSSEISALPDEITQLLAPEDGDIAIITPDTVTIYDSSNVKIVRKNQLDNLNNSALERSTLNNAILLTLQDRIIGNEIPIQAFGEKAPELLQAIDRVLIVGTNPGYYAGLIGKQWVEKIAGLPCQVETAAAFRARKKIRDNNKLFVAISQTGEDPDTVACLRMARVMVSNAILSICSTPLSSVVYNSDMTLMTGGHTAGSRSVEEDFIADLIGLFMLSIVLGRTHRLDKTIASHLVNMLKKLPELMRQTLTAAGNLRNIAEKINLQRRILFICGDAELPIGMKCAEICLNKMSMEAEALSYLQFNANPATGVNTDTAIVALMSGQHVSLFLKGLNRNLIPVNHIIMITDTVNFGKDNGFNNAIKLPQTDEIFFPFTACIIMNLLTEEVSRLRQAPAQPLQSH